ncbi:PAS domain-containing sensor histidine kinase [Spirosoma flavum]|uniref:histidine kinase n=1 Tax=Spirosoma flavum TaxID=2048557 RepID=A0ABW6AKI9_9BACT
MFTDSHLLLQSISEAIFMLDKGGYITYANPAATVITGYSATELLTKHLSLLYTHQDDMIKADYELGLAFKNGRFSAQVLKTKKDATTFWADMIVSPVYDQQNTWTGYSCILHDISKKKKHELELRKNEENYRLMVEGIKDYSIFLLDTTGHILTWNDGAKRLVGYFSDEIIGKHFSIFYTAQDLQNKKPEQELAIAIETGRYEEEGWRVKKNGSAFWATIVLTPLYNKRNRLIGFSKITRDLTERKQSEDTLHESEERYRSLVEQVSDYGIFMLDENGKIISWNKGAKRIKGYTEEEIIGKNFAIFYSEEDNLNGKPPYELKIARAEGKYEEEGWRVRKDGSQFWANVVITAVYNTNGTLIGFSKVTRDLTERKLGEKSLKESHERYRLLADQLTTMNEALSYTNQELQRSNESLQQFAYIASHDLQEPLRKVQSFGDILKSQYGVQLGEGIDYLERMQSAANRMSVLIRDLLLYARITTRPKALSQVSLSEVVESVMSDLEVLIAETGAQVAIDPLPMVRGDKSQLGQLVQNLLSNALKFRRQGVIPVICIRAKWVSAADLPPSIKPAHKADTFLCMEVVDNGIGFEEKYLDRMFQIFQRLHGKNQYGGTGIGLAICEKIVLDYGGAMTAYSQPGQGATFCVYLPGSVNNG